MARTPDFIQYYIDQVISEECVVELNKLAREYEAERRKIDTPERHEGDRRYSALKGKENPNAVANELNALEKKYKDAFKTATAKHAEKEGVPFKEFKEPEPEKSVKKKSAETEKHLNEKQEAMTAKIEASREREKQQEQEQKSEGITSKEEQKAQLVAQMKEQWGMNKEKIQEPQNSDVDTKTDELSREEKHARLVEQMKQQSQELTLNKELNKDRER